MKLILLGFYLLASHLREGLGVDLIAHISQNGIHGSVSFSSPTDDNSNTVVVAVKLNTEASLKWSVRELPVDYTELENRCDDRQLGTELWDFTTILGEINSSTTALTTEQIPLTGSNGIWSRSLLLQAPSGERACATIMAGGNSSVKVAEAKFAGEGGLSGFTLIQWFGSHKATDAVIYTNLKMAGGRRLSEHQWRIYSTDILESEFDKAKGDCNTLQVILMDMTARLGEIKVGKTHIFRDQYLPPLDIGNRQRQLYLVILDDDHPDTFLSCARITPKNPTVLKALVSANGVVGCLSLEQGSQLTPTKARLNITRVTDPVLGGFRIHVLPALPPLDNAQHLDRCKGIGPVYNPTSKAEAGDAPIPGEQSQDRYAVGDISGKLGYVAEREWDSFLPLMGKHSVAHRTLVIYRNGELGIEEPWICANLVRYMWSQPDYKMPVITAEAFYRYPLVGRITFYQPIPFGETTVLVEGLVHADGTTVNTTHEHRWGIHVNPPGKDFFNWTARCVSAGPAFNPFKVNVNTSKEFVVGDLSHRLGNLVISGAKKLLKESRFLFTDDKIPVWGHNSILGKSLVIFDDNGPKARGERLACSKITRIFRRKAVARDWFGNGIPTTVSGKIEFLQETEYGITDIELNMEGLQDVGAYQVHMTPVLEILEFPCEEDTLYDVYNPYHAVSNTGTPDQLKVGDLSGKFGPLDGPTSAQKIGHNDTNLMIFGQTSILGRSVVLHSKSYNKRLACSTIERGYAASEAREIRAIASFHHPQGFAWGYIRMTQLIHNDGSASETVLEVNVRHPGQHDRNQTRNHKWTIYVNAVGIDATVNVLNTRCTAAGYIWNPYYTQLADPLNEDLYRQECGPDMPLRCYVGDLSGRLGTIDLGMGRRVFSDSNIPLEGAVSAMGRSIVILDKDGGSDKFACANIEPDYYTIKYVNVRRPPKFVVSQYLEDIRRVMGIPEWFLTIDSRKTNILYGGSCIQLLVHFKGPQANRLEQDFSRLMSSGRLPEPSLYIPGYVPSRKRVSTISYKLCETADSEQRNSIFSGKRPKSSSETVVRPFLSLMVLALSAHCAFRYLRCGQI